MFRSDALCVQYKGFSPGCVARTVWSAGGGLSTASAASDSDAEAGRCACPHVLQKRLPTSVLLPQFPQNISRCLARLVRSGELRMIHHEVRVLHGPHCSFVGTAAGPYCLCRIVGGKRGRPERLPAAGLHREAKRATHTMAYWSLTKTSTPVRSVTICLHHGCQATAGLFSGCSTWIQWTLDDANLAAPIRKATTPLSHATTR
jgi:hypothetical protein